MSREGLERVRALVIDMDGVLWRGETALPGIAVFFGFLRHHDIVFRLATNNPSLTPLQYVNKLASFGIAVGVEEILTSGMVTARYVAARSPGADVFVIGSEGLREVLAQQGLRITTGGSAEYVVVGLDRKLDYDRLTRATLLIRGGAVFVGCNPDVTLPSEQGLVPGNGATLAYLTASTGVSPIVIGKPETAMFKAALRAMGVSAAQSATLGDRLETDIQGGQGAGMKTILVLSGVTEEAQLKASVVKPDWVYADIEALTRSWETAL